MPARATLIQGAFAAPRPAVWRTRWPTAGPEGPERPPQQQNLIFADFGHGRLTLGIRMQGPSAACTALRASPFARNQSGCARRRPSRTEQGITDLQDVDHSRQAIIAADNREMAETGGRDGDNISCLALLIFYLLRSAPGQPVTSAARADQHRARTDERWIVISGPTTILGYGRGRAGEQPPDHGVVCLRERGPGHKPDFYWPSVVIFFREQSGGNRTHRPSGNRAAHTKRDINGIHRLWNNATYLRIARRPRQDHRGAGLFLR